jgi:hypothetical protein
LSAAGGASLTIVDQLSKRHGREAMQPTGRIKGEFRENTLTINRTTLDELDKSQSESHHASIRKRP